MQINGDASHRFWKSSAAGLVGGLLMAACMMAVMGVTGRGFFTPLNLIAAVFPPFRPIVSGFQPVAAAIGLTGHLLVSVLWAACLGWVNRFLFPNLFRASWSQVSVGLALGFAAWVLTGLRLGPALDPALRMMPPVYAFLAHLVYGLATATVLWAWAGRPAPENPDRIPDGIEPRGDPGGWGLPAR